MTDHELYKTPRIVPNKIFGILPTSIAKIFGKISQREIDEEMIQLIIIDTGPCME